MRVLGIVGWSGSGKTTLIEALIPRLIARGVSVSTVKHAHHGFDIDRPGKDSFRHRAAGAREVLVTSGTRWALLHEGGPLALDALLARMETVDLVLAEGFKTTRGAKIEVFREALGQPPIWPGQPDVVAVASTGPVPGAGRPVLPLDDADIVADWIAEWRGSRIEGS